TSAGLRRRVDLDSASVDPDHKARHVPHGVEPMARAERGDSEPRPIRRELEGPAQLCGYRGVNAPRRRHVHPLARRMAVGLRDPNGEAPQRERLHADLAEEPTILMSDDRDDRLA